MRIAVFGAGGVGGYFGGRLAAAGNEVSFVARGAHLAALRDRGLRLRSGLGDLDLGPVPASDDPADLGPAEIVLLCVKLYDLETAARQLAPLIGPETAVIPLQNGIDAEERLQAMFGTSHVMGGTAHIPASIEAPGVIRHLGTMASLRFGELDGVSSPRAEAFLAACQAAEIDAELVDDVVAAIWRKFLFLAPFAAVTCLARAPIGKAIADARWREFFADAVREVAAVAAVRGVALAEPVIQQTIAAAGRMNPEMKSSMLVDLERGNRLEVEFLSGAVVRLGREAGIPTPRHQHALDDLLPFAKGRAG